jgi:hypothetical protein
MMGNVSPKWGASGPKVVPNMTSVKLGTCIHKLGNSVFSHHSLIIPSSTLVICTLLPSPYLYLGAFVAMGKPMNLGGLS